MSCGRCPSPTAACVQQRRRRNPLALKAINERFLRGDAPGWTRLVPARNPPPYRRSEGPCRRLVTPRAPKARFWAIQRGCIRCALHGGDSVLDRRNPHRHRLRQCGTGDVLAGNRGHHGCDARNDLDALAGGGLRLSHKDRCRGPAHPRRWRASVAGCTGQNAIGRSDPRGLRTDLHRDRVPANGDGRRLVELRGVYGPRLAVDPRRDRGHHDDRHAELDRGRGDDTRCPACGLADVRAGLRHDRRAEHRNDGDDRAGDDRRRSGGAARGAGAHPLQLDRWCSWDTAARTARGRGRLGGFSTL